MAVLTAVRVSITDNILFDKFADMPEFYGSGAAGYRLAMVKEREALLD